MHDGFIQQKLGYDGFSKRPRGATVVPTCCPKPQLFLHGLAAWRARDEGNSQKQSRIFPTVDSLSRISVRLAGVDLQ